MPYNTYNIANPITGNLVSREYCEYLADMLSPWAKVNARAMFGGFGLYRGDRIFGIVVEDTLYFKVSASNRAVYETAGSEPFSYQAKGRRVAMSYWQVPADVLDDAETLCQWAEKAYRVAVESKPKR